MHKPICTESTQYSAAAPPREASIDSILYFTNRKLISDATLRPGGNDNYTNGIHTFKPYIHNTHVYTNLSYRKLISDTAHVRVLLSFQQPTFHFKHSTHILCYCVFEPCSYLFVSSEILKGRLLK